MLEEIREFARDYFIEVVVAASLLLLAWFRGQIWNVVRRWWNAVRRMENAAAAIERDRPWLVRRAPEKGAVAPTSIPIITIANLKGGVGKTTLSANIAAQFAMERKPDANRDQNYKVLVIDLDFQGSLSSMFLDRDIRLPRAGQLSDASEMVLGNLRVRDLVNAHEARNCPNVRVVPAYYDLARIESRLQMKWLIGDIKDDIRFRLRDYLQSEEVQNEYDLIVIDAPPRLTTGTIMALAASTHVLIPTILDRLSGEAVGSFVDQIEELRPLWPWLRYVGVVGTMVAENPALGNDFRVSEAGGLVAIEASIEEIQARRNLAFAADFIMPRESFIADSEKIRQNSALSPAFARLLNDQRSREVKDMFRRLTAEILRRL